MDDLISIVLYGWHLKSGNSRDHRDPGIWVFLFFDISMMSELSESRSRSSAISNFVPNWFGHQLIFQGCSRASSAIFKASSMDLTAPPSPTFWGDAFGLISFSSCFSRLHKFWIADIMRTNWPWEIKASLFTAIKWRCFWISDWLMSPKLTFTRSKVFVPDFLRAFRPSEV